MRTPKETETRQLRYDMARTAPNGTVQRDAYQIPLTYDQLWASPTKKVKEGDFSFPDPLAAGRGADRRRGRRP